MLTKEQIDFIDTIGTLANADMQKSGILASLTTAQAILESGWGKSSLASIGKALFGIKTGSNWNGKVYNAETKECYNGSSYVTINADFRAYDSWEESIADHSKLLCSLSRYAAVVGEKDYKKACQAIQDAGYATAPTYAKELIEVIECYDLTKYDFIKEAEDMSQMLDNTPDEWAEEAVVWAKDNKILQGDENGDYKLHDNCSRQEMLAFLYRLYLIMGVR